MKMFLFGVVSFFLVLLLALIIAFPDLMMMLIYCFFVTHCMA